MMYLLLTKKVKITTVPWLQSYRSNDQGKQGVCVTSVFIFAVIQTTYFKAKKYPHQLHISQDILLLYFHHLLPLTASTIYLTIIPRARMGPESHKGESNNRHFYRYGGHIELTRLKGYYRIPRGHEHISFVFPSAFRDIFFLKFS